MNAKNIISLEKEFTKTESFRAISSNLQNRVEEPDNLLRLFHTYLCNNRRRVPTIIIYLLLVAGWLFGLLYFFFRDARIKSDWLDIRKLVISGKTPNQRKTAERVCLQIEAEEETTPFTQSPSLRFKNTTSLSRNILSSLARRGQEAKSSFQRFLLFPYLAKDLSKLSHGSASRYFKFGIYLSIYLDKIADLAAEISKKTKIKEIHFTYMGLTDNILIASLKKSQTREIRSIQHLHGSVGNALHYRAICSQIVCPNQFDKVVMDSIGFSSQNTYIENIKIPTSPFFHGEERGLLYCTNLLALPANKKKSALWERKNQLARSLNRAIESLSAKYDIDNFYIRIHPREDIADYQDFLDSTHATRQDASGVQAGFKHVICHPSSVLFDYLGKKRVYVYCPNNDLDGVSAILNICDAIGFSQAGELDFLLGLSDQQYLDRISNLIPKKTVYHNDDIVNSDGINYK